MTAPPAQQQGLGAQRLGVLGLAPLFAVLIPNLEEPAAVPEALLTGRVLRDSVQRLYEAPSWRISAVSAHRHERKRLIVTRQENLLCTRLPATAKVLSYKAMPYACAAMLITEGSSERPAEPSG